MPEETSSKEILAILRSMKETANLLKPEEIEKLREILTTLTPEDLKYVKEYAEDKKAVHRLWGKAKNFLLVTAAVVVAYFAIIRNLADPIRNFLLTFLQSGATPPH
jgi:hypothetical protein